MKKVLIITYYWPPAGGPGVQRWLKFVKYFRSFGWEPVVYVPKNGEHPSEDHSLSKDVPEGIEIIKRPVWEPYNLYKKFIGQKNDQKINTGFLTESEKPKMREKIAVWIRGNFFVPDARKTWVKPSYRYLKDYLDKHPVDAIVSSGPPHSMHLIAMQLRKHHRIPWVADFRDPWTNIDFYSELMLTSWADNKHKRLEKEVLCSADVVLSVGKTLGEELTNLGAKNTVVITNGYDSDDITVSDVKKDRAFTIAHIGSLSPARNHPAFWEALSELKESDPGFDRDLRIVLIGKVDVSATRSIAEFGLDGHLERVPYMPHNEIVAVQMRSQVLLLFLNRTANAKGILTGKIFEYMSARRPVLAVGPPNGDAAEMIRETRCGDILDFDNKEGIKQSLKKYYALYREGKLEIDSNGIEKYSRRALTERLVKELNKLVA